jgi:hypothetical protein
MARSLVHSNRAAIARGLELVDPRIANGPGLDDLATLLESILGVSESSLALVLANVNVDCVMSWTQGLYGIADVDTSGYVEPAPMSRTEQKVIGRIRAVLAADGAEGRAIETRLTQRVSDLRKQHRRATRTLAFKSRREPSPATQAWGQLRASTADTAQRGSRLGTSNQPPARPE